MVYPGAQAPSASAGSHLLLYDGVCGLCSRLLQFVLRHDRGQLFDFAPLQSPVGQAIAKGSGGNPSALTSFFVVAEYRTASSRVFTRSDAALFIAGALGWPWKAARLMRLLPPRIRNGAYDLVARNRYRMFGRYDRCLLPSPEFRRRFIDGDGGER